MLTAFFVSQSGFLDDTRFDDDPDEPALNVNGDLEVYLPEGSQVVELIKLVEDDWSTNVMIIYVESGTRNITDQRILQEMSYVESQLNPYLSDSINDDVIYILSLSTVLKKSALVLHEFEKRLSTNLVNLVVLLGKTNVLALKRRRH